MSNKVKSKYYDELLQVLRNHDYKAALRIELGNQDGWLTELLQYKVVRNYINENF